MKILHIIGSNLHSGAGKGAYLLHQGLIELGVSSKVLVQFSDQKTNSNVYSLSSTKYSYIKQFTKAQIDKSFSYVYRNREASIFSTGLTGNDITKLKEYKDADIIHLHWINSGMLSIENISQIKKPIVWTLRDMWAFTGGCHYAMDCLKYTQSCGECPQLGSNSNYDLSRYLSTKKSKKFNQKMKIVGISNWLTECAKMSSVFRDFDIRTISNNISTRDFTPIDMQVSRKILKLPKDKKVILAGAQNINDTYKGFGKFVDAIQLLDNKENYFLLFFGKLDDKIIQQLGFKYKSLGYLSDLVSLQLAYSSADVFVAPSIMDAFGKTIAEAMSCKTPVVCFDASGPKDIVTHKINGYKAKPFDERDLSKGIQWIVYHSEYQALAQKARDDMNVHFNNLVIAEEYLALYEEMLKV